MEFGKSYIRGLPVEEPEAMPAWIPGFDLPPVAVYTPHATHVVRTWRPERRPRAEQIACVKAEAGRRISERFPAWRQANMLARQAELQDIRAEQGGWTEAEREEVAALRAAWEWIKSVRQCSNKLETMDVIPREFRDDGFWPQ
jgi:hypothetical protein